MTDIELQGVTTGGLPYPESTGPLQQGANDIKALALAVDARGGGKLTQSGTTTVTFTAGNGSVTFPAPFKAGTVPVVLALPEFNAGSLVEAAVAMVRTPSATGFQSVAYQVSGAAGYFTGTAKVHWVAVGVGT
jgi:hypothetical protein